MPDTRWRRLAYAMAPWSNRAVCLTALSAGLGGGTDRHASQKLGGVGRHLLSMTAQIGTGLAGFGASVDAPVTATSGNVTPSPAQENPPFRTYGNGRPMGQFLQNLFLTRPKYVQLAAPIESQAQAIRWRISQPSAGMSYCYLTIADRPPEWPFGADVPETRNQRRPAALDLV